MRGGALRHLLEIQEPVSTKGLMGGRVIEWQRVAIVHGSLDFGLSKQVVAAKQVNSEVAGVARIRFREGITAKMRIKFRNEYYNLERPINVQGKNRELIIPFTVGVNDG